MPTRFVLCAQDRFFPAEFMHRVVADRLGVVPNEITAGHAIALSRPKELVNLLASHSVSADKRSTLVRSTRLTSNDATIYLP